MKESKKTRRSHQSDPDIRYGRNFLNARFEAALILAAWSVCLVWTVGYSGLGAYDSSHQHLALILGIPGWVFWGVVVPWVAAVLFSVWFSLFFMADDDLGESDAETDEEETSRPD